MRVGEADARYRRDRLELRGQFAYVSIGDAARLNDSIGQLDRRLAEYRARPARILRRGVYRVWNQGSPRDLVAFVRYENFDTQFRMPSGFQPLKEFDRDAWVTGITYYPDPDVAVKVDYVYLRNQSAVFPAPHLVQRRSRMVVLMELRSSWSRGDRARARRADVREPAERSARVIEISAERFEFWPSEIASNEGEEVELRITSDDTLHGFRIVGAGMNVVDPQARQGRDRRVPFRASKPGRYTFECNRMCGAGHNFMRGVLIVPASAQTRERGHDLRKRGRRRVGVWALAASRRRWSPADRDVRSPGDPLRRHHATEFSEFRLGLDDFTEVETAEEGLGPAFNGTSCAVCHNVPAIGGGGVILEIRAGYRDAAGAFDGLNASGDTLIHMLSTPPHSCQPVIPDDVTVIARRAPIPLFGAGLVEAIPDDTLLALEDPPDRNRDGVSGRAAIVADVATGERRVGRFGWKAQHATLLAFGADAYRNEMGITNDLFPNESAFGIYAAQMRRCDPLPDPEDRRDPLTRRRGIDNFESFMRFLAPVARGPSTTIVATASASSRRSAAPPATCRRSRPDRTRIRCSTASPCRSSRICCCTTSAPATASSRRAAERRDSHAGVVGAAVPPAAAARRQRRTIEDAIQRHGAEANWRGGDSCSFPRGSTAPDGVSPIAVDRRGLHQLPERAEIEVQSSGVRPNLLPISRSSPRAHQRVADRFDLLARQRLLLHAPDRLPLHQLAQELDDRQHELRDRLLHVVRLRIPSHRRGAFRDSRRSARSSAAVTGAAATCAPVLSFPGDPVFCLSDPFHRRLRPPGAAPFGAPAWRKMRSAAQRIVDRRR